MTITQENIRNILVEAGELDKLLKYLSVSPVNDIVQAEICELLEEFESQEQDIELFARIITILEARGWQESQVKQALETLAKARQGERKRLRTVAVGYNPPFVSGLLTASRVLEQGSGKLLQAWIFTNGTNDASISFYDSPDLSDIQASSFLFGVSCIGANLANSDSLAEELGFRSLTAILDGAGSSFCALYRTLERGKGD